MLLLISSVAYADSADKQALKEKMVDMEVSQMGMCDGLRTTLVVHRSKEGKVAHEFIGFSGTRYIVFQESVNATEKLYFTRRGEDVSQNVRPMDWGVPMLQDGPNFFSYHFFPDKQNDCILSQLK